MKKIVWFRKIAVVAWMVGLAGCCQVAPRVSEPAPGLNLMRAPVADHGWEVVEYGGAGFVEEEDGLLRITLGEALTGIRMEPAPVRMNYEVELEVRRVTGNDFFCGLTFPVNDACMTLVVGGWGGGVVGLSSIDNLDASENETSDFMEFKDDVWYRIRLRVIPDRIQAWIDDRQVVDLDTRGKALGMRLGSIEMSMPFGLATYQTTAEYRKFTFQHLKP